MFLRLVLYQFGQKFDVQFPVSSRLSSSDIWIGTFFSNNGSHDYNITTISRMTTAHSDYSVCKWAVYTLYDAISTYISILPNNFQVLLSSNWCRNRILFSFSLIQSFMFNSQPLVDFLSNICRHFSAEIYTAIIRGIIFWLAQIMQIFNQSCFTGRKDIFTSLQRSKQKWTHRTIFKILNTVMFAISGNLLEFW